MTKKPKPTPQEKRAANKLQRREQKKVDKKNKKEADKQAAKDLKKAPKGNAGGTSIFGSQNVHTVVFKRGKQQNTPNITTAKDLRAMKRRRRREGRD